MSQKSENGIIHVLLKTDQPSTVEDSWRPGLLIISRGTAILLLFVYAAYLVFQLKTHAYLFKPQVRRDQEGEEEVEEEEAQEMSTLAAGTALLLVTVLTSFAADYRE